MRRCGRLIRLLAGQKPHAVLRQLGRHVYARHTPMLNLTDIDGCQLLSNKNQVALLRVMCSELDRYSNISKQCPLLKRARYFIRNYRIDLELVPAFSFETEMNVWFDVVVDHNRIIQGYVRSRVSNKNGKDLKLA